MLNKRSGSVKRVRYIVLASILLCFIAIAAWAALTTTRYSNTTAVSGQADGLEPGGDRLNSYAWAMQTMEDTSGNEYLYAGSNRDIFYIILTQGGLTSQDITNIFGNDVPIPSSTGDLAAKIFRK